MEDNGESGGLRAYLLKMGCTDELQRHYGHYECDDVSTSQTSSTSPSADMVHAQPVSSSPSPTAPLSAEAPGLDNVLCKLQDLLSALQVTPFQPNDCVWNNIEILLRLLRERAGPEAGSASVGVQACAKRKNVLSQTASREVLYRSVGVGCELSPPKPQIKAVASKSKPLVTKGGALTPAVEVYALLVYLSFGLTLGGCDRGSSGSGHFM